MSRGGVSPVGAVTVLEATAGPADAPAISEQKRPGTPEAAMSSRMNRIVVPALSCAALVLLPVTARADGPPAAANKPAPAAQARSPMMTLINTAIEEGQVSLRTLVTRLGATTDDNEAFALQRQIEQAKLDTELKVLGIQATFARQEGRAGVAVALERVIAQLRDRRAAVPSEPPAATRPTTGR
jgi:hypothetical protein